MKLKYKIVKVNLIWMTDLVSALMTYIMTCELVLDVLDLRLWLFGLMDPLVHETVGYVRPLKILTYLEPELYEMVDKPEQLMDNVNDISNHINIYTYIIINVIYI